MSRDEKMIARRLKIRQVPPIDVTRAEAAQILETLLEEQFSNKLHAAMTLTCENCKRNGPMYPDLDPNCPMYDENCEDLRQTIWCWNTYSGKEAIRKAVEGKKNIDREDGLLEVNIKIDGKATPGQRDRIRKILRPYFHEDTIRKIPITYTDKDGNLQTLETSPINFVVALLAGVRKNTEKISHDYYSGQMEDQRPVIEFVHSESYEPGLTWHIEPPKILDLPKYISIHGRRAIEETSVVGQTCGTCDYCKGILRYDEHEDKVCDGCSSVFINYVSAESVPEEGEISINYTPEEISTQQFKSSTRKADNDTSQSIKLTNGARKLTKGDIISRRMEICCKELGCTIKQLDSNTALQHAFTEKWNELYGEDMSKQTRRARIKAELKRQQALPMLVVKK